MRPATLDPAVVVDRYRSGATLGELSTEFRASRPRVRRLLVDAGVPIRAAGSAAGIARGPVVAVEDMPARLREHLDWCLLRGLAVSTTRQRRLTVLRLTRWLGDRGRTLLDATETELDAWQGSLRRMTPAGQSIEVSHVRAFYAWAVRYGHLDVDPARRLLQPRRPRRLPRPIREADLLVALQRTDAEARAWLVLAAYAGLRASEVAHLEREDVLDDQEPPALLIRGKGGRERVVPVSARVWEALQDHGLPRTGYIFMRDREYVDRAKVLSRSASAHLRDLGVPATLHQLRHYFATRVYQTSRDLRLTQELMGHASPQTTAGYAAYASEDAARVVAAL